MAPARRPRVSRALGKGLATSSLTTSSTTSSTTAPIPRQDRAQAGCDQNDIEDELRRRRSSATSRRPEEEIISYRKMIKPQRPTLRPYSAAPRGWFPEDLELYYDDLVGRPERSAMSSTTTRRSCEASRRRTSRRSRTARMTSSAVSPRLVPISAADRSLGEHLRHERQFPGAGDGPRPG